MILQPSALALAVGSGLTAGLLAFAARWAAVIVERWDLQSGAALQLDLERRTVLLSTVVRLVMAFQLAALFLYVFTADALAPLFTGAMCAVGTLQASDSGFTVLFLKLVGFVLAGVWLAVDHLDGRAPDQPLVRLKYAFLLPLAPLALLEAVLQVRYFVGLRPDVITSCCGSLFGREGGAAAGLAGLPPVPVALAWAGVLGLAVSAAVVVRASGRGAAILGWASAAAIPISLVAVTTVLSPYVYALPSHHCPFCLLKREYHHVGYVLYAAILGGGVAGMAAGVIGPARAIPSLAREVPALQRRLAVAAGVAFVVLAAAAVLLVSTSELRQ